METAHPPRVLPQYSAHRSGVRQANQNSKLKKRECDYVAETVCFFGISSQGQAGLPNQRGRQRTRAKVRFCQFCQVDFGLMSLFTALDFQCHYLLVNKVPESREHPLPTLRDPGTFTEVQGPLQGGRGSILAGGRARP